MLCIGGIFRLDCSLRLVLITTSSPQFTLPAFLLSTLLKRLYLILHLLLALLPHVINKLRVVIP